VTATGATGADIDRMVDRLFPDDRRKGSASWALLVLAPAVDDEPLRRALDAAGIPDVPVRVSLVLGGINDLPPG
jgi:hypothetical protein